MSDRRWQLQRRAYGSIATVLVVGLLMVWLKPRVEQSLRQRIEAATLRHGAVARIRSVRVGVWPVLRLEGVDLDMGQGRHLQAEALTATWLGSLRLSLRGARFTGLGGIEIRAAATTWQAAGLFGDAFRLRLLAPQTGLTLHRQAAPAGPAWHLDAHDLALGRLVEVQRDALPWLDAGTVDGKVDLESGVDGLRFRTDLRARRLRLGALQGDASEDLPLGEPTDVTLRLEGAWQRQGGRVDVPSLHLTLGGADMSGSLALMDLDADPSLDLVLGLKELDFAALMAMSGLEAPDSLGLPASRPHDLGSARIDVQARGRLSEPASFSVIQKIAFKPPRNLPSGITRLRGDFEFIPTEGTGRDVAINVSPTSPDFVALHDVPPLFLRTLLLAEDAGFYGHPGIDLREMPAALITNWSRGGAARGASTISQQLAKNLFLSRDKQVGRKLQEVAITFLLESALEKARILEIYLNIIEWGPDVRGLRSAARHYFGREPAALSPAQMAFLVSIIPGPILYQRSFAQGTPGPGLRLLVDNLLAKLRLVRAISEAEYEQALADPIVIGGGAPD